jgi:cytidylate kinase
MEKGQLVNLEEINENLARRDQIDSSRAESPLMKMPDAAEVDTSNLTFEEQVAQIVQLAKAKIKMT